MTQRNEQRTTGSLQRCQIPVGGKAPPVSLKKNTCCQPARALLLAAKGKGNGAGAGLGLGPLGPWP